MRFALIFVIIPCVVNAYDGGVSYLRSAFSGINGDLTKITWAHAVNSKEKLYDALESPVDMIEADVSFGHLTNNNQGHRIPIMAHPPEQVSDLSLEEFLRLTLASDTKGVKLDFKSRDALANSVPIIFNATLYADMALPFILNADILPGPINCNVTPVDADYFLTTAIKFPQAILSLGWTTCYGPGNSNGSYSQTDLERMTSLLLEHSIVSEVTFPVRAGLAAKSVDIVSNLVGAAADATLTIWSSSPDDPIDFRALKRLIDTVGHDKILLDLTENHQKQLDSLSAAGSFTPHIMLVMSSLVVLFLSSRS